MRVSDFRQYVLKAANRDALRGQEEDVRFGDPNTEVRGVLFCWMATVDALEHAGREGCNLVVAHEDLWVPYAFRGRPDDYVTWPTNRARCERMVKYGLTVFRCHGTLDEICILDDFIATLGIAETERGPGFHRIAQIEETTVRELADRVRKKLGLDAVRVAGDLDKWVSRLGFAWGGLGLSLNAQFLNQQTLFGVDAMIAGEMDEYAMEMVVDAGIPIIETSHAVSENIGIRNFAERFARDHPRLKVVYHENARPWQFVSGS